MLFCFTIIRVSDGSGARHCEVRSNLDKEIASYLAMTAGVEDPTPIFYFSFVPKGKTKLKYRGHAQIKKLFLVNKSFGNGLVTVDSAVTEKWPMHSEIIGFLLIYLNHSGFFIVVRSQIQ